MAPKMNHCRSTEYCEHGRSQALAEGCQHNHHPLWAQFWSVSDSSPNYNLHTESSSVNHKVRHSKTYKKLGCSCWKKKKKNTNNFKKQLNSQHLSFLNRYLNLKLHVLLWYSMKYWDWTPWGIINRKSFQYSVSSLLWWRLPQCLSSLYNFLLKKSIIIRGCVNVLNLAWQSWKYFNQKAMLAWAFLQSFWLITPAKVMSMFTGKGKFSANLIGKLKTTTTTKTIRFCRLLQLYLSHISSFTLHPFNGNK